MSLKNYSSRPRGDLNAIEFFATNENASRFGDESSGFALVAVGHWTATHFVAIVLPKKDVYSGT
jgi:hypothetical protein